MGRLAPGRTGVLAITGPTVFHGYVTGHGPAGPMVDGLGKLHNGWLDTGDLARVDDDGFVYLSGRAKDLIIRGGHNIDPAIVEQALLAHPGVTSAQAVGRPDAHAGEVPVRSSPWLRVRTSRVRISACRRMTASPSRRPPPSS